MRPSLALAPSTWSKKYVGDGTVSFTIGNSGVNNITVSCSGVDTYLNTTYPSIATLLGGTLASKLTFRVKIKAYLNVYFGGSGNIVTYYGAVRNSGAFTTQSQVVDNANWFMTNVVEPTSTYGNYPLVIEGTSDSFSLTDTLYFAFVLNTNGGMNVQSVITTFDIIVDSREL